MGSRGCLRASALLVLISVFLSACAGASAGGATVWIDAPTDGLTLPSIQPIKIQGHASLAGDVRRVEVWIDGALTATITDLPVQGTLVAYYTIWTPAEPGTYVVQAVAYSGGNVASPADSARVTFGELAAAPGSGPATEPGCPTPVGGGPTPMSCSPLSVDCPTPIGGGSTPVSCGAASNGCPTAVGGGPTPVSCAAPPSGCPTPIGGGPTPVTCDAPVVKFWADPAEIEAGKCTTIHWHAENVQKVVFGGHNQSFDGSYEDCLCANQLYTLTVTLPDGTQQKATVDIAVNGTCVTPEAVDNIAPSAPEPAVPADGLNIACKGSQTLAWLPVDDPSGIAEYQVQVQRHSGNKRWQGAPDGDQSVSGKSTGISVECGWYYRWHVRAIDGAGNASKWSGWSEFSITLN